MAKLENRVLSVLKGQKKTPIHIKELARKAGVKKKEKDEFLRILDSLKTQNRLMDKNGKLILSDSIGLITATIAKVNATFGFATPAEGGQDIFIPGRMLMGSMPGDTVLVRLSRGAGELPEGEVYKILEEAPGRFSGVLRITEQGCYITPDRYVKFDIATDRKTIGAAKDGEKILAELATRGSRHSEHVARVVERFGDAGSAAACCRSILAANNIPIAFPDEASEQARAIAAGSGVSEREIAARLDLRGACVFTIDGADAKDLDDAVSLKKQESGWELGVHIADVSHYVTHGTPLDQEALRRGTSVYYADSVVPMLPVELSNGVCSLNPGEDRLTFSALLTLDSEGSLTGYRFQKSIIRSRVKGVYAEVNAVLDGTASPEILQKYEGLADTLRDMQSLAAVLTKNRFARGGMDFDSVESKILIGPDGKAADIIPRERGVSERVIEEFMLTANEAAATLALKKALPFVYRVHEKPAMDKVENLYGVLAELGIPFRRPKNGVTKASQLAAVLENAAGSGKEAIVNTMVLRAMAKAKYATDNIGHFGLALQNYAHFTSPIRRYPDLTIHRILSAWAGRSSPEAIQSRFASFARESAERSTEREIAAMTAERDCEACYKAEYMLRFVGGEFDGVVSSVTAFGVYVQLPSTVEGLLGMRNLPGQWDFDGSLTLVQRQTNKKLRLGDTIRVRVLGADVGAGQVDFGPAEGSFPA